MRRALLIYSGGLDTTVCLGLLKEEGYDDIHAVTVDVGQSSEDISNAEERAAALGVTQRTVDARSEFAEKFCSAAIAFNANYYGYPLSTAIARPLIAEKAAKYALENGPFDIVVHGCTGKGNDQFRIEYGLRAWLPDAKIYAPVREKNWTRSAEIEYAEKHNLPIGQSKTKIWSIDENLWGRSIEGGQLENPHIEPPEEIFAWTSSTINAPNEPEVVEIQFTDGFPSALNGEKMSAFEIISKANWTAGTHGVGRIDMMEDRLIGLKVRENYECPGATLLITAHKELEGLVCTPQERRFKQIVDQQWAEIVYQGFWGDPLFQDLSAFTAQIQKRVTGTVKLKLYKGSATVIGRSSEWALYSESDASFDDAAFLQSEMTGSVRAHGMASILYSKLVNKS